MKKYSLAILLFISTIMFSSCVPEFSHPPLGVWQSTNPMITIYIDPAYQQPTRPSHFFGFYDLGETEIKIDVFFGGPITFIIEDTLQFIRWEDIPPHNCNILMGTWAMVEDQLHFTPDPRYQERSGYEVIIFERLESYDPINPDNWFPPEDLSDDLEDS